MQLADATGRPRRVLIAAGVTRQEGGPRAILLAANKTDTDIAKELKVGRSTVQAWYDGRRAIPRQHATHLSDRYGIPVSAWPRVKG